MLEQFPSLVTADDNNFFYDQPATLKNNLLQSVKLFDGFFMANQYAMEEQEFLSNNKIGLLVNCQPLELKKTAKQIKCLQFSLISRKGQVQTTVNVRKISQIFKEIEQCLTQKQEGVVLVARQIQHLVATMAGLFIMAKFNWDGQRALAYVLCKKTDIKVSDKYVRLMRNFEKSSHHERLAHIFEHSTIADEQNLIQNTLINSEMKTLPNFYGLSHHRDHSESFGNLKERTVKFVDKVEFIDCRNEAFELSIDLDATPYLDDEITVPVRPPKLTAVQTKLRKFIKDKCNQQMSSSLSLKAQSKQNGKECVAIKSKQIIKRLPRRRAVSKTQESIQSCDDFKVKVKTNNFTVFNSNSAFSSQYPRSSNSSSLAVKHQSRKTQNIDQFSSEFKIKQKTNPTFHQQRQHLSKRCHTENTNHNEHSIIDSAKLNNLFKISKSNKTSHKRLKIQPNRVKTYSFMGGGRHGQMKSSGRLQQMLGERLKARPVVNVNMNVRIDNFNVHSNQETQSGRRNSYKITERRRKKHKEHAN